MKHIFTIIAILLCVSVYGQYVDGSTTDALAKQEMKHVASKQVNRVSVAQNIDVIFHEVNWTVYPGDGLIDGDVLTRFKVVNTNLTDLVFDMSDSLTVDSVMYHSSLIASNRPNDNTVVITLPSVVSTGSMDSIRVFYHGKPEASFYTDAHGNNVPEVYTLSEPYGASDWWPCKNSLTDKIDSININITTSLGNMAGSLGLLQSVDTVGNGVTYHWKHRFPVTTYLVSLAVTNYIEFTEYVHIGIDSFPILNYVYPEHQNYAESSVPRIVKMFDVYDSLFIPYPFMDEKYGHAETQIGGGMEHQTMSTMGGFYDGLMAHELAHQWFGDKVTCKSWEELWLNEGFATYLTGLSIEFLKPKLDWDNWKRGKINNITSDNGGSVFVTDTISFWRLFSSRLTYNKGSYLLHMLRWKMGDDDFFQALRNYLNDPKLAFNYVTNDDLIAHLEAVSGLDLTEFFDDWFYGEGYPSYTVLVSGTQPNYAVNIKQTQSHSSVDYFEMPVEIRFNADTSIVFDNTQNDQWFPFTYDAPINYVEVDPEMWLLMGSSNIILGEEEIEKAKITPVLYPVPATNTVTISNVPLTINSHQIVVVNITGSRVVVPVLSTGNTLELNIENLSSGVYFVSHPTWEKPLRLLK